MSRNGPNEWAALTKDEFLAKQISEVEDEGRPFVRCGCHKKLWMTEAYKCLYCDEWYCKSCAEKHFGKTVEQYWAEKLRPEKPNQAARDIVAMLWRRARSADRRLKAEVASTPYLVRAAGISRTMDTYHAAWSEAHNAAETASRILHGNRV